MQIRISFFGKTKELEPSGKMELSLEKEITIAELRLVLTQKLIESNAQKGATELINDCAFANAERILNNNYLVNNNEELVLLPPVCGG